MRVNQLALKKAERRRASKEDARAILKEKGDIFGSLK